MSKVGEFKGPNRIVYPEQADIMKERILAVGINGTTPDRDVTVDPNTLVSPLGAPFFQMSPIAPSGLPTVGFAITLIDDTLLPAGGGGALTITPWRFIQSLGQENVGSPLYTSLAPATTADYNEEWVSFDVDACNLRFQVEGQDAGPGRFFIVFCEL